MVQDKKKLGLAVPLFSVYSKESVGVGEFGDLPILIDYMKKAGFNVLQLLPLNEMGFDSSPYNPVSLFALEPAYISLRLVPGYEEKSIGKRIEEVREKYPLVKNRVDYRIKVEKIKILHELYKIRPGYRDAVDFLEFENTGDWFEDYASFKVSREGGDREFWIWVQYHLYRQLKDAHEYAKTKGVLLFGDWPYSVSKLSADYFSHPEFFEGNYELGAPPDQYSHKGQRWGILPYDFGNLEEDKFRFFAERLKYAENFYDGVRLDHVLGFFRQWRILETKPRIRRGLPGKYDLEIKREYMARGRKVLQELKKETPLQLVAEDLGMVPEGVKQVLSGLRIPGIDVTRWTGKYRKWGVATLSLFDTSSFAQWWNKEVRPEEKLEWGKKLGLQKAPVGQWSRELLRKFWDFLNKSPDVFVINTIIDWLFLQGVISGDPKKFRVNVPGTAAARNWRLRLPVSLEILLKKVD